MVINIGVRSVMFRKLILSALLSASLLAVAGCGYSPGQRALSGGAIGAGGGAIIGAATGIGPGTGALIGAGAGALTGAATTHNQLNLGN
jgi:osmotically inducible lipoprotein OsmB